MAKTHRFSKWRNKRKLRKTAQGMEEVDTASGDERISLSDTPDFIDSSAQEELDSSVRYLIHFKLVSGHNLAVRDISGTSDPYVKLKHGKFKFRSSIIYRDLNPVWNEKFIFQTKDLSLPLSIRIYDHDIVSSDDFMGQASIDLTQYSHSKLEKITIKLTDPSAATEDLGYLECVLKITAMSSREQYTYQMQQQYKGKRCSGKYWSSVLTVTVIGASDLPAMDNNGFSDPYCKFKLNNQKYKTKVQARTLNPEWKEQFDMKLYHDKPRILHVEVWDRDFPAADDFIGECSIDLTEYEAEIQHDMIVPLEKSPSGMLHLQLVISGLRCYEEDTVTSKAVMKKAHSSYQLHQFVNFFALKDVGLLHITIDKASDLQAPKGSSLKTFVTVELGNAHLRTQTVFDNSDPVWDKIFSFPIKDIHDVVHITVFNERKGKVERLGEVMIPLLRLQVGASKTYVLKGKRCLNRVPGTITIKCDLAYNAVRAGLRTINPREVPVLEEEPRFRRKVLMRNIQRIVELVDPVKRALQFIQEILSWKDPVRSTLAVIIYTVVCLFCEVWIVLLIVVVVFLVFYVSVFIRQDSSYIKETYQRAALEAADLNSDNESDFSDLEDYVHTKQDASEHKNWRQRFRQLQDILLTVQIGTGYVGDLSERIRNLVYWTVPFLCWMAVVVCLLVMVLTYFVHLRYIILVLGLYKITKRLWKPKHIPNNEILDFLSRAPTNFELLQWKELQQKQ